MKSWALGEELSTMRFTILMRVSLSLICSRGRNRGPTQPRGGYLPTPPVVLCSKQGGAAALGASSTQCLASPFFHPVNCFRTSTDGCCPQVNATVGCWEALDPR